MAQPGEGSSAALSFILFLIIFSVLQLYRAVLASSPQLTILGGFIASLLFFFALTCIGNLKRDVGWVESVLSLVIAVASASTVHRVSASTCFLFSVGMLFYISKMSKRLLEKETAANTGRKRK
eukprot:TRINITY_DN1386_c0_g2_i1.p1 TRINITY_DN1386_c0_g2~~TRINITY_DN1386_c0_g2_i1.p1  ORF type:complete len:123 (+),score=23.35 TRINITY_DN1386_c0_g2_i1:189-557(+)